MDSTAGAMGIAQEPRRRDVFANLHLLRALAAIAVVYFHTTSEAGLNLRASVGSHAVDVFFVISGFVIAMIGGSSPRHFLLRRVARIVPAYWAATLAVFAAAALAPGVLRSTRADPVQLLCSLSFVPRQTPDGGILPTLALGWSLNYEMYFYALFALALAAAPHRAPWVCGLAIVAVMLLIDASGTGNPTVRFYARPLVVEFVFGMAAYHVFDAMERRAARFTGRASVRGGLWLAALSSIAAIGFEELHGGLGLPRFVAAGAPAFVLVLAAVLLERLYGVAARARVVELAGESSYVLYLVHPYVIYGLLRTVLPHRTGLTTASTIVLVIALLFVAAAVAGMIHVWLEKPVLAALHAAIAGRNSPRVVA